MDNLINIGIPSKGRLRVDVLKIFKKKKLKIISERGERDLIGSIKNKPYVKILFSKGVTQFRLVKSLGATEAYPFTGSAELITDITSTGETLKANNLRILKDGEILKSEACLLTSKKNVKKKRLNNLIKLLSK